MFRSLRMKIGALLTALLAAGVLSADGPGAKAPGGATQEADGVGAKLKDIQVRLDELGKDFAAQLKAAEAKLREAVKNAERAEAEAKRRQCEVEALQDVVRKREEEIAKA